MIEDRAYIIYKGKFNPSISFCGYDHRGMPWITFSDGGKEYPCRKYDLTILTPSSRIDLGRTVVAVDGRVSSNVTDAVHCRGGRYVLIEKGYWIDAVPFSSVRLIELEDDPDALHVLGYLKAMASLRTIAHPDVPEGDTGDTISLGDKYGRLFVEKGGLLSAYLQGLRPAPASIVGACPVIFPFGCNRSQHLAVRNAMENPVSTVQGPPGTGKTQTILNIIANLILRGKTVEVVSNNNSAVANVGEKLEKAGMGFLVACLGNRTNKEAFIENQTGAVPDYVSTWTLPAPLRAKLSSRTSRIEKRLETMFRRDIELHETKTALNEVQFQKGEFEKSTPVRPRRRIYPLLSSDMIIREKARLATNIPQSGLFRKIGTMWRKALGIPQDGDVESELDALYYRQKERELKRICRRNDRYLRLFRFDTALDRLRDYSMRLFKDAVARKYKTTSREVFSIDDPRDRPSAFLSQYPVILSTTFSATSNVNPGTPFDCVIMDESSQVDIAAGALALSVTGRAVIVGDLKQLPNVVTREDHEKGDRIAARYRIPDRYNLVRHSFLESVMEVFGAPNITLREHYRCHPLIIEFCNRAFYDGELVVMTKGSFEDDALELLTTVKGHHQRGKHNTRQVEEIAENLGRWKDGAGEEEPSVGIIAPYNEQITLLGKTLPEEEIATVHRFQGREKDIIVFSTVNNEPNEFTDDPHLLNVAVSRAVRKFILVAPAGTPADGNIKALEEFIRYYRGGETEGKVRSVFDLLYDGYTEERIRFIRRHGEISDVLSENLFYGVINDVLSKMGLTGKIRIVNQYPLRYVIDFDAEEFTEEEKTYGRRQGTHLDFLLFSRMGRTPVMAIEVDGVAFHKEESVQGKRDRLKDSIMKKAGLRLLRVSTDEAGLERKIEAALGKSQTTVAV